MHLGRSFLHVSSLPWEDKSFQSVETAEELVPTRARGSVVLGGESMVIEEDEGGAGGRDLI